MRPVKSHSVPVCTFENVRKCFARMPVSQPGLALPLNGGGPNVVRNVLRDTPSVKIAAYLR